MTGTPSLADLGIGQLFDLVPDPVVIGDIHTGMIIAWNDAAAGTFGYSREQAIGLPLEVLVPPELRDAHHAGLSHYAAGDGGSLVGAADLVEVPALCADGRRIWVELRLASLDAPTGMRRFVLAVLRDVTARRQAQDQTREALHASEAANEMLRDFIAMLSHDLRAPLAGISMSLDMLATRADRLSSEQRHDILDRGRRQAKLTVTLLDELLQVSAIEAGQVRPEPHLVAILPLLEAAVETSGADVTVQASAELTALVDGQHLQRAVVNLLGNAVKYGRPPILVTAAVTDDELRVCVIDHGDGVPAELRHRLFEKFSRGVATSSEHSGVGLGLAIVSGLMAAAGGAVGYENLTGSGSGSRFTLTWPQ